MKKFLIILIILICSILLFLNFYKYLYLFEVDKNTKNELFNQCKPIIDVRVFPMTVGDWKKKSNDKNPEYAISQHSFKDEWEARITLASSLGDKLNNESFLGFISYSKPISYNGYYNYKGDLLFIEKEMPTTSSYCRYNVSGNLIETSYRDNELYMGFNAKKQLIYRCYHDFGCDYLNRKYKTP